MKRILLLMMTLVLAALGAKAAITISSASVSVGGTTYQGYYISGATEGEIAQFLNGSASVSGVSPEQLKSAEYIKVGSSSSPNVLGDADLAALEKLSAAKYLDIDGSTLATGANIASIKAGPAIEAVTLPNGLSKAQVNAAGAALTECNEEFGSCLSLNAEMETVQKTFYPYTIGGVEYNADPSTLTDNGDGTYSYHFTSVERDLTNAEGYPIYIYQNPDISNMEFGTSEGELVENVINPWYSEWYIKVSKFAVQVQGTEGSYYYVDPFTNENVTIQPADESNIQTGNGTKYLIVDFGNNTKTYKLSSKKFKYQYLDLDGHTAFTDESTNPDDDMKITLQCNETGTITPVTREITQPVEGGDCDVIAYVNTPGSLYKATSLDVNDVISATGIVISGNINNGDISQGGNQGNSDDPQSTQNDSDKYDSNGAIPAFYFNNTQAPIKSVDMSDAIIDDYRHLRVLNAYDKYLESVVFPKNQEKIPNYCCYANGNTGNYKLANVTFPENVKSIGNFAFADTKIVNLVLPGSITSVGHHAFYTCKELETVEMEALDGSCTFGEYVFATSTVKHVTLSEGVSAISEHMFDACIALESVRIPTTAKTIKTQAFQFCSSLHKLIIPEGVELLERNVFEGAGLTDVYVMATSADKVPKIYCLNPDGSGTGTFSKKNILGNNTPPQKVRGVDYDETTPEETALSWYQEEFSDMTFGLGGQNCMIQLHYPESMKEFYNGTASLPEGWKNNLINDVDRDIFNWEIGLAEDSGWLSTIYAYGSNEYDTAHPSSHKGNSAPTIGPTAGGLYWPHQEDYFIRLAAGYSSGDEPTAEAWRQIPLQGITSANDIIYTKKYDDTWYTMAFPWDMDDNTLFSTFNQKCEIVEFKGAELLDVDDSSTENIKEFSLVFHFDEVAKTHYINEDHSKEYERIESEHTRTVTVNMGQAQATKKYYTYKNKATGELVYWPYHTGSEASAEEKAMQKEYNDILHMLVYAGHPYMIHPAIGAKVNQPKDCTIAGVKKIKPGEGLYASYSSLAKVAEANKAEWSVTSRTRTKTIDEKGNITYTYSDTEAWTTETGASGGKYYFIGNINDETITKDETTGEVINNDHGAQDMPLPSYFLGVSPLDNYYPRFYKKAKEGSGIGKWTQYSAIIRPDDTALANVESLYLNKVNSPTGTGQAKGATVELGAWDFHETVIIEENKISTIIEEALEKDPATPIIHMNAVYNIKGEMVRSDSSSIEGLPKGIYIVNGKKYMVK